MKKVYIFFLWIIGNSLFAQTEIDGIMMAKNQLCTGVIYEKSQWTNFWEGTFYRDNLNMGTVSTQKIAINGNYGISRKLNVIFSIPYVITKASAGTMKGQKGLQDLSLFVKWMPYEKNFGDNSLSFYVIGGYSFPTTDYSADYMPLNLGLHSKIGSLRLMGDLQMGNYFTTFSGAFEKRSNITIERDAYFTDRMHYTNEVDLPNAINTNFRFGYRTNLLIVEGIVDNFITQKGGFDITSNNMPFPSNTMNFTKLGINVKYYVPNVSGLSIIGGYNQVVKGRNVGQSKTFYGGLFYIFDFKSKSSKTQNSNENQ